MTLPSRVVKELKRKEYRIVELLDIIAFSSSFYDPFVKARLNKQKLILIALKNIGKCHTRIHL